MEDDDWWMHLYVMLSRATSLDDVLLLRALEADFSKRVKATHAKAEQIVRTMGWGAKKGERK